MKIPQILTLIHENPSDSYVDPIEDTFSSMKWAKNKILHIICRGFQ